MKRERGSTGAFIMKVGWVGAWVHGCVGAWVEWVYIYVGYIGAKCCNFWNFPPNLQHSAMHCGCFFFTFMSVSRKEVRNIRPSFLGLPLAVRVLIVVN